MPIILKQYKTIGGNTQLDPLYLVNDDDQELAERYCKIEKLKHPNVDYIIKSYKYLGKSDFINQSYPTYLLFKFNFEIRIDDMIMVTKVLHVDIDEASGICMDGIKFELMNNDLYEDKLTDTIYASGYAKIAIEFFGDKIFNKSEMLSKAKTWIRNKLNYMRENNINRFEFAKLKKK